jgi:hypothetical protein
LLALVAAAWLQFRAINRLAEATASLPAIVWM